MPTRVLSFCILLTVVCGSGCDDSDVGEQPPASSDGGAVGGGSELPMDASVSNDGQGDGGDGEPMGPQVNGESELSYARDVAPIFAAKCVPCHNASSAIDVDLTDPFDKEHGIVNRENTWVANGSEQTLIVDPGNVTNSFLITKITETALDAHVDGAPMPMVIAKVSEQELADVEQWIAGGAQDDAFFRDQIAPIFGTEVTLRRTAGKCTFCHFPGSAYRPNVLDVFDETNGMVNADSVYGGKIVAPGDPEASVLLRKLSGDSAVGARMPREFPRLTQPEIDAVTGWVAAGARDD